MKRYEAIRGLDADQMATFIEQIADCKRCPVNECGEQFISRGSCRIHWRKWLEGDVIFSETVQG